MARIKEAWGPISLCAALGLVMAGHALADGVVISSGALAGACYEAAKSGTPSEDGIHLCTRALAEDALDAKDRAGTLINRSVLLIRAKSYRQALSDLEVAQRLAPGLGEGDVNRGAALLGLHRWNEAVAALNLGLQERASEPEKAYFNRATAREQLDDLTGAYLDYRKAAEIAPHWDAPRQELTRFHVESGQTPG